MFKFYTFEIQKFQITSVGEKTKTKVVVHNDIYNFAVENFHLYLFSVLSIHFKTSKVNTRE
jgi:hypothetical protein